MHAPYLQAMPKGGNRSYGGNPHFGVWNKRDARFLVVHKGKSHKVHRLVCEAFHGEPNMDTPVCMHIDENSANNRAENLRWATQKENLNCPTFLEYCKSRVGNDSPVIKARIKQKMKAVL
jgi:hypothetical protein